MSRQELVERQRAERLHERRQMRSGTWIEITAYRNSQDIDVLVGGKTLVEHVTYAAFIKGNVSGRQHGARRRDRTGESVVMNNGEKATIIAYRCTGDLDVEFEDGTKVFHITYSHFKSGHVAKPGQKRVRHTVPKNSRTECEKVFALQVEMAEQILIDNGVGTEAAPHVLQELGHMLFGKELYPKKD